jgi:dihydroceramidase
MGDDLSMLLAVGAVLHQLLCFEATTAQRRKYTALILGSVIPVAVYHVVANEIVLHEISFALMIFLVSRRTRALIKGRVKSEESRKALGRLTTLGICKLLYILANDNAVLTCCSVCSFRVLPLEHRLPPLQPRHGL